MKFALPFVVVAMLAASCASYTISVNTPDPQPYRTGHEGIMLGGAGQTDLVLPPGYAPAGYSIVGKYSRGVWLHPKATAMFVEDEMGTPFVLVACDLWGVTEGTSHKVAEVLSKNPATAFLGEENIVIAATHAHHSTGGYLTSSDYALASLVFGVDPFAIDLVVDSLASAITKAVTSARPVSLGIGRTTIPNVSKNRSIQPFRKNLKSDIESIVPGGIEHLTDDSAAVLSVRPVLTLITLTPIEGYDPQIVLCHFPIHPTITGSATEVYSSDVFGIASERIRKATGKTAGFFNGAEGDVTVNSDRHDITVAMNAGTIIADSAIALLRRIQPLPEKRFSVRSFGFELVGQEFPYNGEDAACRCLRGATTQATTKSPVNGTAMVGGASDGRTMLYYMGLRDGVMSSVCDPVDGTKINAIVAADKLFVTNKKVSTITSGLIAELIEGDGPSAATTTLFTIGDWSIFCSPAEFTTMMGLYLERDVMKATGSKNVLIAGLSDDYASYIATPCEYQLQFYEGASTLYGQATGELFRYHVSSLAAAAPVASSSRKGRSATYDCGAELDLGLNVIAEQRSWIPEEGLANLILNEDGNQRNIVLLDTLHSSDGSAIPVKATDVISFTVAGGEQYPVFQLVKTDQCEQITSTPRESPVYVADQNDIVTIDGYNGKLGVWTYRLLLNDSLLKDTDTYRITAHVKSSDGREVWKRSRCFTSDAR